MLPVALFVWLLLEIAAYLALARLGLHADWPLAIAGALGGVLGIRAGINTTTWFFAIVLGSPAKPMSSKTMLKMIGIEYLAFLRTFILVLPLERLWMPADRLRPCARPILLVHGYGCSRGVWYRLRRRLEAAGHVVATVSLTPPFASIGQLEPQLARRIEEVCAATGARQLTLVGHSMGGLVGRCYLARHGGERVARLITLSTPHQGTALARLGIGRNAREMEPDSLWLRDMAEEKLPVPCVSLRNPYDNYVMPQDLQKHPAARDVELPPSGHIAQLYDPAVATVVIAECATTGEIPA